MAEDIKEPKYKIGDFVRCNYDFYDFFSYWYDEELPSPPHHGVIVDMMLDDSWYMETVYQIYCLDGQYRFFLEDEVELINKFQTEND
jgi:hypothetical protein